MKLIKIIDYSVKFYLCLRYKEEEIESKGPSLLS